MKCAGYLVIDCLEGGREGNRYITSLLPLSSSLRPYVISSYDFILSPSSGAVVLPSSLLFLLSPDDRGREDQVQSDGSLFLTIIFV